MTANLYPLPKPRPGHRFVPAKVGATNDSSITVLVECPTWCDASEHLTEPVRELSDIMHRGPVASVNVPTFGYGAYPVQMHAWVEADPVASDAEFRQAHIEVQDAGGNEFCHLTPEMAERLADEVIGFASELRHQARIARLANQTAGDSDPDMDEALRRVRQGGAV